MKTRKQIPQSQALHYKLLLLNLEIERQIKEQRAEEAAKKEKEKTQCSQ